MGGAGGVVVGVVRGGGGWAWGGVVVAAFGTGWGWSGVMTFAVVEGRTSTVAGASGIMQAGICLGAGLGPSWLGWTSGQDSFSTSWVVVTVLLLTAASIVTIVGLRTQQPEPATTARQEGR